MEKKKEIVLSGIRPTGFLHLGNYFGALRNWARMQYEYDCYFFIADWHSLTTHADTKDLKVNTRRLVSELIAGGLDPEACVIYSQSDIPEIAELYLYLNMLAYRGELEKTATFKDKVRQQPENVNAGLLTYPVLQAADILIHRALKVPVGKDQEQHIEMTRNFAERFNYRYGNVFPLPVAFSYGGELLRILNLDGTGKMSKSENPMNTIYLNDDDALITKKIMKAKTDQGPAVENMQKPDYIQGLFTLLRLVSESDVVEKYESDFNQCVIRYGDMKKQLAEDMVSFIRPLREKAQNLQSDPAHIDEILSEGAVKARKSAAATLLKVREVMGF
ncbi:MAG: tryptophan--tRNA ligase [Bacteroidota bacterium]|nr:tryptophan--tRNA ligase [Bacteroidota bacterium]MDP4211469.1 tryptophan--tRNA ligase [Bacteroidota bacterium]MDP4249818.1 tryptophan--tRNA ligase [Bacteroidota bacterium]